MKTKIGFFRNLFAKQIILTVAFLFFVNFNLISQISFTHPSLNEQWELGSTQNIVIENSSSTTYTGCYVIIEPPNAPEETIAENYTLNTGTNTLSWYIDPRIFTPESGYKIKIMSNSYNLLAESQQFEITSSPNIYGVFFPVAGNYWYNGKSYEIHWISYHITSVDIAYSLDGYTNWQTIESDLYANDGSNFYSWAVSGITGTNQNAKIRVSSNSDPNVYALSETFTLAENPIVTFTQPAGGEQWELGSTHDIIFNNSSQTTYNNCHIYAEWGGNSRQVVSNYPLTPGTHTVSWTIDPNDFYEVANGYTIVVEDESYNLIGQCQSFEVIAATPQITEIMNPVTGSYWYNGNDYLIKWNSLSITNINIEYSLDGSTNWQTIVSNESAFDGYNHYTWAVSGITGTYPNAKIKISSSSDPNVFALSETFTLAENSCISFTSPTNGEQWELGSTHNIIFNNSSSTTFENGYIEGQWTGGSGIITDEYDISTSSNTINWTINPNNFQIANGYKIVVKDHNDNIIGQSSIFEVIAASTPQITGILNPAAGSYWYNGNNYDINWGSLSVSNVDIDYSLDGSTNWVTIATNITSNDGSNIYVWAVSGITGTYPNAKIKISSSSDPNVYALSEAFTLADQAAGIVSNNKQKIINIYPNPTNGIVNFEFAETNIQKLTISDITGKQIIEKTKLQQNEQIDLSNFESGIYLISIQTDKEIFTKKIIKE